MKNDVLKLYVWEKNDKYIVAGEALAWKLFTSIYHIVMHTVWKGYVRATQQKPSDRNFKITYSKKR